MNLKKENTLVNNTIDLSKYHKYIRFSNDYIKVYSNDDKTGIIDFDGNGIFKLRNREICLCDNKYFILVYNDSYTICYKNTKIKNVKNYEYIKEGVFWILTNDDKEFYYDIEQDKIICGPYSYVEQINNCFIIEQDNKKGLVDLSGNTLVPCIYDRIISFENDKAIVQKKSRVGVYDFKRKIEIIPCKYDLIHKYNSEFFSCTKNKKAKIIDENNNKIFRCNYNILTNFKYNYAVIQKEDKLGIIDRFGNIVVEPIYEGSIPTILKDKFIFYDNPTIKVVDINNNVLEYENKIRYDNFYVVKKDDKYGVLNTLTGDLILDTKYDFIKPEYSLVTHKLYFLSNKNNKNHLFDENGKLVINKTFDRSIVNGVIGKIGNKKYIFGTNDKILEVNYDLLFFIKGLIKIIKNHRQGVINYDGKQIIDTIYDRIEIYDKFILASINNEYIVFDKEGNVIINHLLKRPDFINDKIIIDKKLYDLDKLKIEYKIRLEDNSKLVKESSFETEKERNESFYNNFKELEKLNKKIDEYEKKKNESVRKLEHDYILHFEFVDDDVIDKKQELLKK